MKLVLPSNPLTQTSMKKIFTLSFSVLLFLGLSKSQAVTFTIGVQNYSFSPATVTVNTGDTIMWMWNGGSHTTTSTQIPIGATAWNASLNSNESMFMYVPTIAGSYDYICQPHVSMGMGGHFTVVNTSGISENHLEGVTLNTAVLGDDQLLVKFNLPTPSSVSVMLYNAIGNKVNTLLTSMKQPAGDYEEKFLLPSLKSGVYVLQVQTSEGMLTKRILIP